MIFKKLYKFLWVFFSLAIIVSISYQLSNISHWDQVYKKIWENLTGKEMILLIITLLLVILNYFLETLKWFFLLPQKYEISIQKAFNNIMTGCSLSMFLPSFIGHAAGRTVGLRKEVIPVAGYTTVLCHISQIAGIIAGTFLVLLWTHSYFPAFSNIFFFSLLLSATLASFLFLIYFNAILTFGGRMLKKWIFKNKKYRILKFNFWQLTYIWFLSLIRYYVFSIQFCLLLYICGGYLKPEILLGGTTLVNVIQSGLPIPISIQGLAKADIALRIFNSFTIPSGAIIIASILLWVINNLLPALIGLAFLSGSITNKHVKIRRLYI